MLEFLTARDARSLADEAASCGVTIDDVERFEVGEQGVRARAGQLLRLAVVGEAQAAVTHLQIASLRGEFGRFFYIVPCQHNYSLAGTYFLWLPGALAEPVVHGRRIFGGKWHCTDAATLARLAGAPALKAAVKQLPFAKHTATGSIKLDWNVQVAADADGTSQLIVQAGSRQLDTSYQALDATIAVARALAPLLGPPARAAQGRYVPPPYASIAASLRAAG